MPHTISLEEMIIAVVSLMFDINSVLVLQWCGRLSPPTQWLLVMAVASLEITAHLLAMATGHWKEEKEGHMSEFLPSPGVKNLVLDTFCVFLEPLNVD